MKNTLKRILVLTLVVILSLSFFPSDIFADDSNVLYVAKNGNDSNPGTIDRPLASLKKAIDMSVSMEKSEENPVRIVLRGGDYKLTETIVLEEKHSYMHISSYEGEKATVTMADTIPYSEFETVTDPEVLNLLPEQARGYVKYVNLPSLGITDFGSMHKFSYGSMYAAKNGYKSPALLVVNGKAMDIARWPNGNYDEIIGNVATEAGKEAFQVDTTRIERWTTAKYAVSNGYMGWNYADNSEYIERVDVEKKAIYLSGRPANGVRPGMRYRVMNLIEELDIPNEYYLDRDTGNLYFFPNPEEQIKDIKFAAKTKNLFQYEGVSFVTLEDLTLTGTCMYAVRMSGKDNTDNLINRCTISGIGMVAVYIEGMRNGVTNCNVFDCGAGGLWINNGTQTNMTSDLTQEQNYLQYNTLYNTSLIHKNYATAFNCFGTGNIISHNRASHNDALMFAFHGNDNIIEYNDLYDAVRETGDSGLIYSWGSYTSANNHIRYNYIHSGIGPEYRGSERMFVCGVYFDNCFSSSHVYNNIFYDLYQPILFHDGMFNSFNNNLVVDVVNDGRIGTFDGGTRAAMETRNQRWKTLHEQYGEVLTGAQMSAGGLGSDPAIFNDFYRRYDPEDPMWNRPGYEYLSEVEENVYRPYKNVRKNNASFGVEKPHEFPEMVLDLGIFENNYTTTEKYPDFWSAKTGKYNIDYDYIRSKVPGFEELNFEDIGNGEHGLATSAFHTIYPLDKEKNVEAGDLRFVWEKSNGADKYRLMVARDPEFKDMVFDKILNVSYQDITGLKYGNRTYYWKVQAISTSTAYDEYSWNVGGTKSFTTAAVAEVDAREYYKVEERAKEIYNTIDAGDGPGQCPQIYVDNLGNVIDYAENVMNNNPTMAQVNKCALALEREMTSLAQHRNPINVDISKEMFADLEAWKGDEGTLPELDKGVFSWDPKESGTRAIGYTSRVINAYEILTFKARTDPSDSFGLVLRSQAQSSFAWRTRSYLLWIYQGAIEVQRYSPGALIIETVKTDFDLSKWNTWEFGILNDNPDGPRIIIRVNGEEIYNYVDTDKEKALTEDGYFTIMTSGKGKGFQLASPDAQVVDDNWLNK